MDAITGGMTGGMNYRVLSYKRLKSGVLWLVDDDLVHNLVPTEGLNHMLNTEFKGGAQVGTWYLALFQGNYTPVAGDTAATFSASATEATAYSEATRVQWVEGTVAGGQLDNAASRAEFTMTSLITVYGAALLSATAKGATTGVLSSIARFSSPKISVDVIRVTAGYVLTSA